MAIQEYKVRCAVCGEEFVAKRRHARLCSPRCRKRAERGAPTKRDTNVTDYGWTAESQKALDEIGHRMTKKARELVTRAMWIQVQENTKEQSQKLRELHAQADEEKERWFNLNKTAPGLMTYEDFQLIRGCLHPDRQPEEKRERYNRAFHAFLQLEKAVKKMRLTDLRRHGTGWDKIHPRYKEPAKPRRSTTDD